MVRTRVGYAGGTQPNPTYHKLGDHTETLQVDFDPTVISYSQMLQIFWENHNPSHSAWSRQYMAAVFYHNQEQKEAIDQSLASIAPQIRGSIQTKVMPYTGFTLAEDYHQKYILRRSSALLKEFQRMYPGLEGFVDSTAAARLNGYLAGHGGCDRLQAEIDDFGLSSEGRKQLLQAVCGRR